MSNQNPQLNRLKETGFSLLSEGKSIRIKANGYSMYPAIKPGSLILIDPIMAGGDPRLGEIIAIKRDKGLIVHRLSKIITINGISHYVARGDSNPYADNPVKIDMIAGRITHSEATAENPVPAEIKINLKPNYFINRLRVIFILLKIKIRSLVK